MDVFMINEIQNPFLKSWSTNEVKMLMPPTVNRGEYETYLENKRVALVGGSQNLDIEKVKKYDVVIHLNSHNYLRHQSCFGNEMPAHVFYDNGNNYNVDFFNYLNAFGCAPKFAFFSPLHYGSLPIYCAYRNFGTKLDWIFSTEFLGRNPFGYRYEWANAFLAQLDTLPFLGMLAMQHLLLHPVSEIFVCGMDFYKGEAKRDDRHYGAHDIIKNVEAVQRMSLDRRVVVDAPMLSAVREWIEIKEAQNE